jgi:DNA repair protein RecO (recombination protein O)
MGAALRSASLAAYVLHSHEWSESSLIVDVFTRERGRLAVVAKGARRPYSQLRAVLLPFLPISIALGKAPTDEAADLFTLRQAEFLGGHPLLAAGALFAAVEVPRTSGPAPGLVRRLRGHPARPGRGR